MSRVLYFDCFSGASGDMILGALIDAGLPVDELRQALGSLAIGEYAMTTERVDRAGIAATKFRVREPQHHHGGSTAGHSHSHRSLAAIRTLIDGCALSASGKARAISLFQRLGDTEAAIHQIPVDEVHLHEVGALDSIIDIVGSVFGLEWFGADQVSASPLNVGSGTVQCQHGTFPVPAPATAKLVEGVPIYSNGVPAELLTPTGALLITGYASSYGTIPPMTIDTIGYGAGERNPAGVPNVLRLIVGESAASGSVERVVVIECEIDDMNPQIFGMLMDRLYTAGALEVFYVPIQMKKNRPGTLVTTVAPPERREAMSQVLFRETTTIGLRYQELVRERLDREEVQVETPIGPVRFKVASRAGRVVNVAPEFDDCARLATEHGLSVKEVQAIAGKAYLDRQGE